MKQSYKEIIKYGLVGIIGLGVDFGAFFIFRDVLHINYIVSHILSSTFAITNNFLLNSYFTFKATDKLWQRGLSFFGIAAVGLALGAALLPILVGAINLILERIDSFSLSQSSVQSLAKLGITVFVAALQFLLNKYFTFKKQAE